MKYINKIRNFYIPFDYPKFALVISIAAFAFAASSHNTPCLSAQSTCSVGSDNEFTGNISLKGGTAYKSTLDASGITAESSRRSRSPVHCAAKEPALCRIICVTS